MYATDDAPTVDEEHCPELSPNITRASVVRRRARAQRLRYILGIVLRGATFQATLVVPQWEERNASTRSI